MLNMRTQEKGFSLIEILIAALILAFVLVVSLRLNVAVLGMVGRTAPPELKPTRLRSTATAWAQAELEFLKQVGFDSACYPGTPPCNFWSPNDCAGITSTWPSEAPDIPRDSNGNPIFYAAHLAVEFDATGPPNDLLLVRAELYRDPAECGGQPFLVAYTSLAGR